MHQFLWEFLVFLIITHKKTVKCHFWLSRNWNFCWTFYFLILKMGIVWLNWKIKLNYLPASIKAVNPLLSWWSMLAPLSNNICTMSLCPYWTAKNKKKIKLYTKHRKKSQKSSKMSMYVFSKNKYNSSKRKFFLVKK